MLGGLDLTLRVKLNSDDVDSITTAGPLGSVLAEEIGVWWGFNDARADDKWNSPHDPVLALWIARPDLFLERRGSVRIDGEGVTEFVPDPRGSAVSGRGATGLSPGSSAVA